MFIADNFTVNVITFEASQFQANSKSHQKQIDS